MVSAPSSALHLRRQGVDNTPGDWPHGEGPCLGDRTPGASCRGRLRGSNPATSGARSHPPHIALSYWGTSSPVRPPGFKRQD